jgi:hypothetical protein
VKLSDKEIAELGVVSLPGFGIRPS